MIENVSNYQVFLNKRVLDSLGLDQHTVAQKIADEAISFDGIYKAVTAKTLQTTHFSEGMLNSLQNGYNQKFSGDVIAAPLSSNLIIWKKRNQSRLWIFLRYPCSDSFFMEIASNKGVLLKDMKL